MEQFTKCFMAKFCLRPGMILMILIFSFFLNVANGKAFPEEQNNYSPDFIPTITGPDTACAGNWGYIYSTEPGMTGYIWTISGGGFINAGNGTNTITVTWNSVGSQSVSVIYNTATSYSTLNVNVLPVLTVGITITASANPVCEGTSVTFTAIPVNGGTSPVYQWKVNGINIGTNAPTFTFAPANGDLVICQIISSELCTTGSQATSNMILMVVMDNLPVGVSIGASANPVCEGISVTFIATPFNGGSSPQYQWEVNGNNVGSNNPVYTYIPINGDVVLCQLTSIVTCSEGNPAISNPITMTVSPTAPVTITITASANPSCFGNSVVYIATPNNGGSNPDYQWKVNGNNAGTNSPVFSYIPVDGDIITCNWKH